MSDKTPSSPAGVGIAGLLGVLFIGLKLTGFISWSWWFVLAPFWVPVAIGLLGLALVILLWMWGDR